MHFQPSQSLRPRNRADERDFARGVKSRGGFTLIEILVVVVILGLVSAIIVPQLGSRTDLNAISGARQLTADLLFAQSRAVATQKKHYIQFSAAGNSYQVLDSISPIHVITQPVLQSPYQVFFNSGSLAGVTLGTVNFDTQAILAFDELGAPYSYSTVTSTLSPLNSGTVTVVCGSHITTVSVMPYSGEILVQ